MGTLLIAVKNALSSLILATARKHRGQAILHPSNRVPIPTRSPCRWRFLKFRGKLEKDLLENWAPAIEIAFAGMDPNILEHFGAVKREHQDLRGHIVKSIVYVFGALDKLRVIFARTSNRIRV